MDLDTLKTLFTYDPLTGVFTYCVSNGNRKAGAPAGYLNTLGYCVIGVNKKKYLAHRLAWLYMHGELPPKYIDHINGVRSDNRIANLRVTTQSENMQNQRTAKANSKSGLLGACPCKGKWRSEIFVNGKKRSLGVFDTAQEAHEKYLEAKRILHITCSI